MASNLLEVPSSTRNSGDDELPIIVDISYNEQSWRLLIWNGEARQNHAFTQFEGALGALLLALFSSQVGIAPPPSMA